jgi:poly-gamma-glutamate system protein
VRLRSRAARAVPPGRRGYRPLAFLLIGALSIGSYAVVVRFPDSSVPGWVLEARHRAVQTAIEGQRAILRYRQQVGLPINTADRLHTGLVGTQESRITTELGSSEAKRTSTNPVFAAAVVDMLFRAGVRRGDVVAVGMSGSFPAFNLAVDAAIESMGATPITISSVGASQYGANEVALTWLDMERALAEKGVIHSRSIAVAPGGTELVGNHPAPGTKLRRNLAERSGLSVIPVIPLEQEVFLRVSLYREAASALERPIRAFVNVGASAADVGPGEAGESIIAPGLSRPKLSRYEAERLGVVGQMSTAGLPIINMLDVSRLAGRYNLEWDPGRRPTARDLAAPPPNPVGVVLALAGLLVVVATMHVLGLFRVPAWHMPAALRTRRRPGPVPSEDTTGTSKPSSGVAGPIGFQP